MKSHIPFVLTVTMLAVAACQKTPEQTVDSQTSYPVTISPTLTKVTENYFEKGDAIGLTIVRSSGNYAENQKLTYDGSLFEGSLSWYTPSTEASTFKAYYPYNDSGATTFSVATDQTSGLSSSDFISAVQTEVYPSENAVAMVFKHQLTRLNISVVNNAGGSYSNLSIGGIVPKAIISENLTAMADGSAAKTSITPFKGSNAGEYYAIIPPQNAALTISATVNGKVLEQTLPTVEYLPGREHNVNVTIENDALTVTVTGSIEGWGGVDDPIVYSKRLIRKVYVYGGGSEYFEFRLSYNPSGKVTEIKMYLEDGSDYQEGCQVSYGTDYTQVYFYQRGDGELYELHYENGQIVRMIEKQTNEYFDFVYDDHNHYSYVLVDGYDDAFNVLWLGNDIIQAERGNITPSSYLDLDFLSSWFAGEFCGDGSAMYILAIVTEGAFFPASEHLPAFGTGIPRIDYTFLPDGHVREMKCYKEDETLAYKFKLYFMDEPESNDEGYE